MISSLYKLYYRSKGNRTPLEDFNTECLVGIFNYVPEIGNLFAVQFLELPVGAYKFTTQEYYPLSDDPNCFVDMVVKNDSCICFVENKVDSTEGYEQINRYQKVLQSFPKGLQKEMRYITKHSDVKTGQLNNFKQYRWYEVAVFLLLHFPENVLVVDYHQFLKQQHMAQETKFTTDAVIALKNFQVAYETARLHFSTGYHLMMKIFPKVKLHKQNVKSYQKIVYGERISIKTLDVFETNDQYAEILIGLHFHEVKYQVQLWLASDHLLGETILDRAVKANIFDVVEKNEHGYMINFNSKIYNFIEVEESEIKKWFQESLQKLKNFIIDNPDIKWNSKLILENTK